MLVLALATEETTLWWVALGIGLVVILVVIALLTFLRRLVEDIDVGVAELWAMATRVAANTATVWQLNVTARHLSQIEEEALLHDDLLASL